MSIVYADALYDQYPAYLANPPKVLTTEEKERYENQQRITSAVVAAFENPKFENGTDAEKKALKSQVQELMNEVSQLTKQTGSMTENRTLL